MDAQFWLDRWQRKEIGFHQPEINADLQRYWPTLGCAADAPVFVPLCGKSRDLVWLRSQGHAVIGIELAERAIAEFFDELSLPVQPRLVGRLQRWEAGGYTLYQGDFFDLPADALMHVGAAYDRAALIALPPPMRANYASRLIQLLPAAAPLLLLSMDYPQEQMTGPPFSVSETEVRALFEPQRQITLLATRDTLVDEPRLRQRGLQRLHEQTYLIRRR